MIGMTREQIGEAIYNAQYAHKGGRWELVETKDVWYAIADNFLRMTRDYPDRQALARLAGHLRQNAREVEAGHKRLGSYSVPWNRLSWTMQMNRLGAETLERIIGETCRCCEGLGIIRNPDATYYEETCDGWYTGQYSTNDAEEIDCPDCDGTGFATPEPAPFSGVVLDDDLPF